MSENKLNKIKFTTFDSKNGIFEKAYGFDEQDSTFKFKLYLKCKSRNFSGVKLIESTKEPLFVDFDSIEMFLINTASDGTLSKTRIIPNAVNIGFGFAINIGNVKNDILITFNTDIKSLDDSLYLTRTSLKFDGVNDVSEKFEISNPNSGGKGKLEIRKNFIIGYEEVISSVSYDVLDEAQKKVATLALDAKRRSSTELFPGEYFILENHDSKYNLVNSVPKPVKIETGKSTKITFENRDIIGKIKILKRDSNTNELVSQGTFILTNLVTGSRKKFVINDLVCYTVSGVPFGPYQLEEVNLTQGEQASDEGIKFEITKNEDYHELTFHTTNKIVEIQTLFDEFSQPKENDEIIDINPEDIKDVDDMLSAETINLDQDVKDQLQSNDEIMAETFDMNDELKIAKAMAEMARSGETNIIDQVYSTETNVSQDIEKDVTIVEEELTLEDPALDIEEVEVKSKSKKLKSIGKSKSAPKKSKKALDSTKNSSERSSHLLNAAIIIVSIILIGLLIAFGMSNAS